jgi:hypothetical protein
MDSQAVRESFARLWPAGRLVATTRQLLDAGLDSRLIALAVRLGLIHRLRRGVYIPMHQWQDRKPWVQDSLVLAGHIAASNGQLVYSHFSAARLHQLNVWNSSRSIHVVASYRPSMAGQAGDTVLHSFSLAPNEVVQRVIPGVGPARYTNLQRTVLDCAMAAPFTQAVVIGDSALHAGLERLELDVALDLLHRRRGVARARKAVSAMNGLSESAGETRTRLILAELPIEQPELQVTLYPGGCEYRADFAWRGIKLILEFDGNTKYFDFGPTDEALVAERERENALIEDGWRFIRVKWKDLSNPEILKARIMKAYLAAEQAAA